MADDQEQLAAEARELWEKLFLGFWRLWGFSPGMAETCITSPLNEHVFGRLADFQRQYDPLSLQVDQQTRRLYG